MVIQLCVFKKFLSFKGRVGNGWRYRRNKTDHEFIIIDCHGYMWFIISISLKINNLQCLTIWL